MRTPYVPLELPIKDLDHARLINLVGEANASIAQYNGLLENLVNPQVLLSPLTNQEAVLSSRIEGTEATLEEVLKHEAGEIQTPEKEKDIQEIVNYRQALRLATLELVDRKLGLSLVLQIHKVLMNSVRGRDKSPGEFRKDQNWIGPKGAPIEKATYVPPSPLRLMDHLQNWERYIQSKDMDPMIQAAVMHAQFELIHPFRDGNGRIGRLLIPLLLFSQGRLNEPSFYMSGYLDQERDAYLANLDGISKRGDWTNWIEFFLIAAIEQAKVDLKKVRAIHKLYDEMKVKVRDTTRSQYSQSAVDAIFERPIFRATDFAVASKIPKPTVNVILRQLKEAGILTSLQPGAGRRAEILGFPELVNTVDGRKVL